MIISLASVRLLPPATWLNDDNGRRNVLRLLISASRHGRLLFSYSSNDTIVTTFFSSLDLGVRCIFRFRTSTSNRRCSPILDNHLRSLPHQWPMLDSRNPHLSLIPPRRTLYFYDDFLLPLAGFVKAWVAKQEHKSFFFLRYSIW